MRLILQVLSGPMAGKEIVAEEHTSVRIGRTSKADVATGDTFMSREHFMVECDGQACRMRDLQSRNGTEVNEEVVAEAVLREGDRVRAGHTEFVVRIDTGAAAAQQRISEPDKVTEPVQMPDQGTVPDSRARRRPEAAPQAESEQPPAKAFAPQVAPPPEVVDAQTRDTVVKDAAVSEAAPVQPAPSQAEPARPPTPQASAQQQQATSRPRIPPPPPSKLVPKTPTKKELLDSLATYEAATPVGRLLKILRNQPEPLMALVDATRDKKLLGLLRESGEEYQSLYKDESSANVAPYLVRLPPNARLLRQMGREGWGRSWGVYLTCKLPLAELREYFRKTLMITTPDGMEFFSRFYDPKFFRNFLNVCTEAEAEKYFGPISSYFMEDERPEILLEFKRTGRGAEKKGHLLSMPE